MKHGWKVIVVAICVLAGCDNSDTVDGLTKYRDQLNKLVSQQTGIASRLTALKAQRDKEAQVLKQMQGPEADKDLQQMAPDLEKTTNGKVTTNDKLPNGAERVVITGSGGPPTSAQAFHNVGVAAPGVVVVNVNLNLADWNAELQQAPPPPAPPPAPMGGAMLSDGGIPGMPLMPEAKGMMGLPPGSKTKAVLADISADEDKLRALAATTAELPGIMTDKNHIDQQLRDLNGANRAKSVSQLVDLLLTGNPPLLTDAKIALSPDGQADIHGDLTPGHQLPEVGQRVAAQWDVVSTQGDAKSGVDVKIRKKGSMAPGFPPPPRPAMAQPPAQQPPMPQPAPQPAPQHTQPHAGPQRPPNRAPPPARGATGHPPPGHSSAPGRPSTGH